MHLDRRLGAAAVAALLCGGALAKERKPAPGSCAGCHPALRDLLPESHPALEGATLAGCTGCHQPSAEAKLDGFATAVHAAHQKGPDCAHCHPGGRKLGLAGTRLVLGARSKEDAALQREALASWASGSFTAAAHQKAKVSCRGCHGAELPVLGSTVESGRCLACHPLAELQERSAKGLEFKDRNPHKSHLGEMDCTTCHHAHAASEVYCLGCHPKFEMVIPGSQRGG